MVIAVCKPETSWLPIWKAPLLIQASFAPRQRFSLPFLRLLSEQTIAAYVEHTMTNEARTRCRVCSDSCTLMLSFPSPQLDDDDGTEIIEAEPFAAKQFCKEPEGARAAVQRLHHNVPAIALIHRMGRSGD